MVDSGRRPKGRGYGLTMMDACEESWKEALLKINGISGSVVKSRLRLRQKNSAKFGQKRAKFGQKRAKFCQKLPKSCQKVAEKTGFGGRNLIKICRFSRFRSSIKFQRRCGARQGMHGDWARSSGGAGPVKRLLTECPRSRRRNRRNAEQSPNRWQAHGGDGYGSGAGGARDASVAR